MTQTQQQRGRQQPQPPPPADQQPALARPNETVESSGLATRTTSSSELAPTAAAAQQQYEIQSALVLARQFPRNEDEAYARLMRSSKRTSFAEDAEYSFPRGGQTITGPSVNLAREAARLWGNIRYGIDILRDDGVTRQIRGWAWDLETNLKVTAEDDFRKEVQRKQKEGGTKWVQADERDLRELTFRRGAILVRNCILQLLPPDFIEDARAVCAVTRKDRAEKDPDGERKRVVLGFAELNVTVTMLEEHLGHPLAQASPAQIARLRTIYRSIADGNSTWAEYAPKKAPEPTAGAAGSTLDAIAAAAAAKNESENPTPEG